MRLTCEKQETAVFSLPPPPLVGCKTKAIWARRWSYSHYRRANSEALRSVYTVVSSRRTKWCCCVCVQHLGICFNTNSTVSNRFAILWDSFLLTHFDGLPKLCYKPVSEVLQIVSQHQNQQQQVCLWLDVKGELYDDDASWNTSTSQHCTATKPGTGRPLLTLS